MWKRTIRIAILFVAAVCLPLVAHAATSLQPETLQAFNQYVKAVETEIQLRIDGKDQFLWLDEHPRKRAKVRQGEILIENFDPDTDVPDGLIHDWGAVMFVPKASVKQVIQLLTDYDRHKEVYSEVVDSKVLERGDQWVRAYLRLIKKKVLTVVLNTEHELRIEKVSDRRWHLLSYSMRITEVTDAGEPDEKELPVGEDRGFLWRLYAYWQLEQVEEGVFVECRTLSLTRDTPWGLGWMLKPFIRDVPRESLESTLEATRQALQSRRPSEGGGD